MKKEIFYFLISIVFFALSFPAFGFWPLSFVALVPFFTILNSKDHYSRKNIFLLSFLFGANTSAILLSVAFSKYLLMFCTLVLIYGLLFGLFGIIYIQLKKKTIYTIFLFASLWVIFEWVRQLIFQDFDYTTISYTSYALPQLLSFAAIGGRYLVSFIIALINAFLGYSLLHGVNKKFKKVFIGSLCIIVSLYVTNKIYLSSGDKSGHEVSFSTMQVKEFFSPYSEMQNGKLVLNTEIERLTEESIQKHADYIIYPYNFVNHAITTKDNPLQKTYINAYFEDVDATLKKIIPKNTTFIFWTDDLKKGDDIKIYDETEFWQNGTTTNYYQKRSIHPFYDITSDYFRNFRVINQPYDYTASKEDKIIAIGNERFSNLNCSELNYTYLARHDRNLGANIILSVGYSSVFEHPVIGESNLVLVQLRAIETGVPVIRADIRGPSVFVDKNGIIISKMNVDQNNILFQRLFIEDNPQKTIYVLFGDYLFITLLFIFITYFYFYKYREE